MKGLKLSPTSFMKYVPSSERRRRKRSRSPTRLPEYQVPIPELPRYRVPTSPMRPPSPVSPSVGKALGHLGLRGLGLTPQGVAVQVGLGLLEGLDYSMPWSQQAPERGQGYQFPPDGTVCCSGGAEGNNAVDWIAASGCGSMGNRCGLGLQVPQLINGNQSNVYQPMSPNQGYLVMIGPGRYIAGGPSARMTYGEIRFYPNGATEPVWSPARAPGIWPLPRSAPPPPAIYERYQAAPNPRPAARPNPYQKPAVSVSVNPDTNTRSAPRLDHHEQLPPHTGDREKKGTIAASKVGALISAIYDGTTEADEIVQILSDNLEGNPCRRTKGMAERANCVFNNLGKLDVGQAAEDLIRNHIEDKAWGKFYGAGKKAPFGSQLPGGTMPDVPTHNLSQRT